MLNRELTARERIEQEGRAPVLGWAQDRKIDLRKTDIRKTFKAVERAIKKALKVS